jgi:hypothetical protein
MTTHAKNIIHTSETHNRVNVNLLLSRSLSLYLEFLILLGKNLSKTIGVEFRVIIIIIIIVAVDVGTPCKSHYCERV